MERLEGFCTENEWRRAYKEMNHMEESWVNSGAIVLKFWMHIDKDEQERELALVFGLAYLGTCDRLVICGRRITKGMLGEIEHAAAHEIPIFWIQEDYSPRRRSIGKIEYEEIRGW